MTAERREGEAESQFCAAFSRWRSHPTWGSALRPGRAAGRSSGSRRARRTCTAWLWVGSSAATARASARGPARLLARREGAMSVFAVARPSLPNGETGANSSSNQAAPCVPSALQPILGPDRQGGVGGYFGRAGPLRWAAKQPLFVPRHPPATEPKQQQRPSMALLPRWPAKCAWLVLLCCCDRGAQTRFPCWAELHKQAPKICKGHCKSWWQRALPQHNKSKSCRAAYSPTCTGTGTTAVLHVSCIPSIAVRSPRLR